MAARENQRNPQVVCSALALVALLTHVLGLVQPSLAASGSSQQGESAATAAASTQPLWSYQVKPSNYVGNQGPGGNGGYSGLGGPASLFDAFTGLSQRQGALGQGSPFLSILPIILIAAGGLLLLLPMLTMMMASPFGGGAFGAGGYQNYGYPQVSALNRRRSLDSSGGGALGSQRGIIELIEHVSSTIEDLSRKYALAPAAAASATSGGASSGGGSHGGPQKRSAKALNNLAPNQQQPQLAGEVPPAHTAANHKPAASDEATNSVAANGLSNLVGGSL